MTDAAFESCVRDQSNANLHTTYSVTTIKTAKIEGTPAVRLDGKDLGDAAFVPGDLEDAILDAGSK